MEIEISIYEDCLNLIDKFGESNKPSFKMFCQNWQHAMFQHIYAAQTTVIEVIQTTKAILHLAKRIVCAKDGLEKISIDQNDRRNCRRIGGMYLMYAVYFKQPTNQYVKVLLSYETWQNLITFIKCLPVNKSTDEVRYIFWKLYKEDAFRFTAFDYDLGLENLIDYDRLYGIHNGYKYVDVVRVKLKQKLITVTETEKVLPNMLELEKEYNNSKTSLFATNKSTKPLPSTKIFHEIQEAIKSIHNTLDEKDMQNNSSSSSRLNNKEIKKELKRKAAGYATNYEESHAEDIFRQETKKHFGKPTVRQLMTQELPEFITEDLKNNSTEDEDSDIISLNFKRQIN